MRGTGRRRKPTFEHRRVQRRGRAAGSASLRALAARGCPAMLGLAAPSQNSLRSLRSLRSNSRDESEHEARCARGHKPCASRRRKGALPAARPRLCRGIEVRVAGTPRWWPRGRRHPAGAISGAARSAGLGSARSSHLSALRELTRRACPSAANAVSVASCAARPQAEHRSAVVAKRRPPQHEPLPGAACRDALTFRTQSGRPRTAAMCRQQPCTSADVSFQCDRIMVP